LESKKSKTARKIYFSDLKKLFTSKNAIFYLLCCGLHVGVYSGLFTLLNQIIQPFFVDNKDSEIGMMGFLAIIAGIIGSYLCGFALDKTKKFKIISSITVISSLISISLLTGILHYSNMVAIFILVGINGFAMTSQFTVAYDFMAELTFPVSESSMSAVLNLSYGIFGFLITQFTQMAIQGKSKPYNGLYLLSKFGFLTKIKSEIFSWNRSFEHAAQFLHERGAPSTESRSGNQRRWK
jgi:MFS family permease